MRHMHSIIRKFLERWGIMGGKKRANYVADFETTTDPEDCRVWAYGLANIDTAETLWDVEIGTSIHRFAGRMAEEDSVCYFHNLKFDGMFIMDYLFREGYTHTLGDTLRKGQFSTLISDMGSFYSITVCWRSGKRTEFRDSLKKLPYSVSVIAKAFNQPDPKGTLDYTRYREPGYIATADERAYIAADVMIVARALKSQFSEGMTKLTVGSDALAEFKGLKGKRLFDKLFPVLPEVMDQEIRAAYRGGWTYAAERYRKQELGPGAVYDVNSLYPSVMYDRILPYGEPVYAPGLPQADRDYPLFIVSITFTAKLKPGHVPCIQIKGTSHFLATEYQTNIKDPVTMSCTNVDLELWQKHYDLNILAYNGGWRFHGVTGLFTDYIDKWMEVKSANTGALRALAKLMLNSLYGKFATNPNVTPKIPVFDDENNVVKLVMGPEDSKDPIYTAMGAFITAYARAVTITAAQDNYETFAYADTDSLHLLTIDPPVGLDVDDNKLGAWKKEYVFDKALYIRAKQYIERLYPVIPFVAHHETHVAGMPERIAKQISIEQVLSGTSQRFAGKLQPKRVPGGIVLEDVGFTLTLD
jgi:hypothetical protein